MKGLILCAYHKDCILESAEGRLELGVLPAIFFAQGAEAPLGFGPDSPPSGLEAGEATQFLSPSQLPARLESAWEALMREETGRSALRAQWQESAAGLEGFVCHILPVGTRYRWPLEEDPERLRQLEILQRNLAQGGLLFVPESALSWLKAIQAVPEHPWVRALERYQETALAGLYFCGRHRLDLRRPQIMGIWNLDPESFSSCCEEGLAHTREHAQKLLASGADLLDIGAESTRPGAVSLSSAAERARLEGELRWARQKLDCPLSVDSYHSHTIRWLLEEGLADIINDVGRFVEEKRSDRDHNVFLVLKESPAAYILMAYREHDAVVQDFQSCLEGILCQLQKRLEQAFELGLDLRKILVDPGIGFGKGVENDLLLIAHAPRALRALARPCLIAHSRKRCMGLLSAKAVQDRDIPSILAASLAMAHGAAMLRLHRCDFAKEARDLALISRSIRRV